MMFIKEKREGGGGGVAVTYRQLFGHADLIRITVSYRLDRTSSPNTLVLS